MLITVALALVEGDEAVALATVLAGFFDGG
jgi:hypothetical protein